MTIDQIMKRYSYDQLKEMYAKDRKLIQDRLYKLGKTEFKQSRTYQKYYSKLPKVRGLKNKEDLAAAFFDAQKLILSGFTTITKQRQQKKKILKSLERHGYDFVTEENYWDFYQFMEWFEDNKLKTVYGSPTDEALQTYLDAVKTRSDPEELKKIFMEYLEGGQKGKFSDYV